MNRSLLYFYVIGIVLTLLFSIGFYYLSIRKKIQLPSIMFIALFAIVIYLPIAQLLKYHSLRSFMDFTAWTEILNNIISTGKPISSIQYFFTGQSTNWFAAHFTPLLYLLAVPFKLWPYSETLIIMNCLLMASSIIPLYKLALTCHERKQFGLFMAVLLLWYPTFQYIVLYEFEMLRFSIPIILWMLYFWEKKNTVLYFLFVLLAVLVREEVGLTIMMFGVYVVLFEKRRLIGGMTIFIGLAAFTVITQVVMPVFIRAEASYEHVAASFFSAFGDTPVEVIKTVISHPRQVFSTIVKPIKVANVFMLFLPLLFVPLLAPLVLISTLANFGIVLLSKTITHSSYMLYYVSPSIPFIFYAFIKGWPRLLSILENSNKKRIHNRTGNVESAAMISILSVLLVINIFFGPSPVSLQFWFRDLRPAPFRTQNFHYSAYKVTGHHRIVKEFYRLIPDSAVVSTQQFLSPRLFKKRGAMIFPRLESLDGEIKADYVFFDKTNNGMKKIAPAYNTQLDFDLIEKDEETWGLVKSKDGYFLYRRI